MSAAILRLPNLLYCLKWNWTFIPEWKVMERSIESYDDSVHQDVYYKYYTSIRRKRWNDEAQLPVNLYGMGNHSDIPNGDHINLYNEDWPPNFP